MSRYNITVTKNGIEYDVAYGYDYPCIEYFLHVHMRPPPFLHVHMRPPSFLAGIEPPPDDDDPVLLAWKALKALNSERGEDEDSGVVFMIASHFTLLAHPETPDKIQYSNSEILELMEAWEVPEEHRSQVAMDLPF
jgi:hypothetical protein